MREGVDSRANPGVLLLSGKVKCLPRPRQGLWTIAFLTFLSPWCMAPSTSAPSIDDLFSTACRFSEYSKGTEYLSEATTRLGREISKEIGQSSLKKGKNHL